MYALKPQCMEVWTPPGDFVGFVREKISIYNLEFEIVDKSENIVGRIQGPARTLCTCGVTEMFLKVLSDDYAVQLATITRIWNTDISMFTQNVYFSDPCMAVKTKSLMVGAAFLMVTRIISGILFNSNSSKSFFVHRNICIFNRIIQTVKQKFILFIVSIYQVRIIVI